MKSSMDEANFVSRRAFFRSMRWAPYAFLPAPLCLKVLGLGPETSFFPSFLFSEFHLKPHYPSQSPLEDVLALVAPGADGFLTEKYAFEIQRHLDAWSQSLKLVPPALNAIAEFLDPSIAANTFTPNEQIGQRFENGVETLLRRFAPKPVAGRDSFLEELRRYLAGFEQFDIAQFEIVRIRQTANNPLTVEAEIRYDIAGKMSGGAGREERIGIWETLWSQWEPERWRAEKWHPTEETLARAQNPLFVDVTLNALGQTSSYRQQLLRGADHWRTVLDGASNVDVYGNNGVAAGDFNNDGLDDLYVCQPAGLPNRLYRNRGDGTFEDVTENSGVGVLDGTSCALFADFRNTGLQDLLVIAEGGPLLFLNQGNGKFLLKQGAFQFARPPEGTFTHAAVADYDRDGRLDIYFCLYTYYLGLDQYHYPSPYFDARNGPANFLLHNEGNGTFVDRTEVSGLNRENDRFSFACAWGDCDSNGWPDLYVANDFGRSNLYRNKGDGTFAAVSEEARVNDIGAGMSACWADFDNSGHQDIYVSNMWSAAGQRISSQSQFHQNEPPNIRSFYQQHARGNSLYKNSGHGRFENISKPAGVEMGRWAWSSDAWDFDHDGFSDLYITNGYISGPDVQDLSSFFWRQVVAKSPQNALPSLPYERGWNAINELIRSDRTWNGYERNVLYRNNHDGSFSDVSGVSGLDFLDDSRSFALADLDQDGRLEVILKNRNAPQLRILHNVMKEIGNSIAFRLRGTKSNRDAIGAAVTVQSGKLRQTKYLQCGSGFLSQHTKELFFGLGKSQGSVTATIRWPNGLTQTFENLPANHRIALEEGSQQFSAKPFSVSPPAFADSGSPLQLAPLPSPVDTWLIEPLRAPEFSLPDIAGNLRTLDSLRGAVSLLCFWAIASPESTRQLQIFQQSLSHFDSHLLHVAAINVDEPADALSAHSFAAKERFSFPMLFATSEVAGIYNILYRYLFDRRRDLSVPTSLLIDKSGMIIKVYQGLVETKKLKEDLSAIPQSDEERLQKALPFPGTLHQGRFRRNDFTYGVALFQRGYLDQAAASFKQVVAAKPADPEAYYNLGTLYLRKNSLRDARIYLEQTVKLRPEYPEAWNNLAMVAAQDGRQDEAIRDFKRSLSIRPDYVTALLNLGNLYRRQGISGDAEQLLRRALELEPENPESNYSLGMLFARQENFSDARELLEKAVRLRPNYPEALNNLGILLTRQGRTSEAEEKFKACIAAAPNYDQAYLNLARVYMLHQENEKAREILLALLKLQPQHKLAQQALEMLN
jgi:Flp pilus assembly protein TadD/peroxiredoxin